MAASTKKSKMADLTSQIKEFAVKIGAETVGVAPIERFAEAPQGHRPTDMLPGTKSVVAFIVPQLAGYCESAPSNAYIQYGYVFKNLLIDRIAWEIGRFIDDRGFWALPYCREGQTTLEVEGANPNPYTERRYRDKEKAPKIKISFRGDVCMRHAAEVAGVGQIPVSGVFSTPEHGPRVRIGLCFTTAELEPTPLIKDELCNHCLRCVRECPGQAISENGPIEFNPVKCVRMVTRIPGTYEDALKNIMNRRNAAWDEETRLRGDARFVVYNSFGGTGLCGSPCVNVCPIGKRKIK